MSAGRIQLISTRGGGIRIIKDAAASDEILLDLTRMLFEAPWQEGRHADKSVAFEFRVTQDVKDAYVKAWRDHQFSGVDLSSFAPCVFRAVPIVVASFADP